MKQHRVELRRSARADLTDIFEYVLLASGSETIAEWYSDRLLTACERIGLAAEAGRRRDDLGVGLRVWSFERRVTITNRIVGDTVQISGLFYGGRDLEGFYRPSRL